jgi:hypothetical protein
MGKPLAASRTEMTEMVLPNETNTLGRALGGVVLHWMDICAAILIQRGNPGVHAGRESRKLHVTISEIVAYPNTDRKCLVTYALTQLCANGCGHGAGRRPTRTGQAVRP